MTDRHSGYIVTLADDIRDDDAEAGVLTAIRMIKGVVAVTAIFSSTEQHIAHERARAELEKNLFRVLRPKHDPWTCPDCLHQRGDSP